MNRPLKPKHPPKTGNPLSTLHICNNWTFGLVEPLHRDDLTGLFPPLQVITMRDYVPKIIGTESFRDHIGPYSGYNPSVNPSAANVFSTAAFRFGHATVPPVIRRLNESFEEHELFPSLELHNTFFTPWRFIREGQHTQLPTKHSHKTHREGKKGLEASRKSKMLIYSLVQIDDLRLESFLY